jgi:hypothetical protein
MFDQFDIRLAGKCVWLINYMLMQQQIKMLIE